MPKIAQYESQQPVRTELINQPTPASLPASSFSDPTFKAILRLTEIGADIKQRSDTTSAEESAVQFERDKNDVFFNPESGYFNTQGKTAYDNSAATVERLEELKRQYGEKLNSNSKAMFDRVADKHITNAKMSISQHASKGLKAWEISTIESQVENTIENASLYWDQPEQLKVQNVLGRQAIIDSSRMMGISEEATAEKLQTFESSFAKSTIEAATQSSSFNGRLALEEYGEKLEGPDKVKITKLIETKEKTEKTQQVANMAVLTAGKLVDQYDSRSEIIDEINKISDPELRKKTMTETMTQFNAKKNAEKEQQAEYYNQGIEHFNKGGTANSFASQNPEAWEGMSSSQRNNLLNGKHMTTDQIKFNTLMSLPRKELAKIEPADYAESFKPADLNKLRSAIDKAKKGQAVTSVQTVSQKINLIAEQFHGKKSTWKGNKVKTEKVQALMNAVQDEIEAAEEQKEGKLTPTEIDEILNDFSRRYVVERSAFGIDYLMPDINIDISNTPPEQVSELSKFVETHGDESFKQVKDILKKNDKPITVDNILNVYRQATR